MNRSSHKAGQCLAIFGKTAWKKSDAAWFRLHRRRSFRVRSIFDGEFPAVLLAERDLAPTHVLVCQAEPGVREKVFISKAVAQGVDENNDDLLLDLWITLRSTGVRTLGSVMPASEVCQ